MHRFGLLFPAFLTGCLVLDGLDDLQPPGEGGAGQGGDGSGGNIEPGEDLGTWQVLIASPYVLGVTVDELEIVDGAVIATLTTNVSSSEEPPFGYTATLGSQVLAIDAPVERFLARIEAGGEVAWVSRVSSSYEATADSKTHLAVDETRGVAVIAATADGSIDGVEEEIEFARAYVVERDLLTGEFVGGRTFGRSATTVRDLHVDGSTARVVGMSEAEDACSSTVNGDSDPWGYIASFTDLGNVGQCTVDFVQENVEITQLRQNDGTWVTMSKRGGGGQLVVCGTALQGGDALFAEMDLATTPATCVQAEDIGASSVELAAVPESRSVWVARTASPANFTLLRDDGPSLDAVAEASLTVSAAVTSKSFTATVGSLDDGILLFATERPVVATQPVGFLTLFDMTGDRFRSFGLLGASDGISAVAIDGGQSLVVGSSLSAPALGLLASEQALGVIAAFDLGDLWDDDVDDCAYQLPNVECGNDPICTGELSIEPADRCDGSGNCKTWPEQDCPGSFPCVDDACVPDCDDDFDCIAPTHCVTDFADESWGQCRECANATHCAASTVGRACVEDNSCGCGSDVDCAGLWIESCDSQDAFCRQCDIDADCGVAGRPYCPDTPAWRYFCSECRNDADCGSSGKGHLCGGFGLDTGHAYGECGCTDSSHCVGIGTGLCDAATNTCI